MITLNYSDQVVSITWTYAQPGVPYGPGYPMPHMNITDRSTGLVVGSYTGQHGGAGLDTERAQEIVDHLRSIMMLDEIARAI